MHLDATARALGELDTNPHRLDRRHHFTGDLRGQRLGEHRHVAETPQVQLERLRLDAELVWLILDDHLGQVWLGGHRTDRGELIGREAHGRDMGRCREHLDVVDGLAHGRAENGEIFECHDVQRIGANFDALPHVGGNERAQLHERSRPDVGNDLGRRQRTKATAVLDRHASREAIQESRCIEISCSGCIHHSLDWLRLDVHDVVAVDHDRAALVSSDGGELTVLA